MAEVTETRPTDPLSVKTALAEIGLDGLPENVLVYEVSGPLFFGAVENFEKALADTHSESAALLIRLVRVPFMDITGIQALESILEKFRLAGVTVWLREANERVAAKLVKAGVNSGTSPWNPIDSLASASRIAIERGSGHD